GYHPLQDDPFFIRLVARIDNFIEKNPEAPINITPIGCPYCGIALSAKEDFSPKCPHCGVSDMKFTGGGVARMRGKWPSRMKANPLSAVDAPIAPPFSEYKTKPALVVPPAP